VIVYIAIIGVFLFLFERFKPNKPFISSPKWFVRAICLNLITLVLFLLGSVTWELWFQSVTFFKLDVDLPLPIKGLITYVAFHFIFYWWHRAKHYYKPLWIIFHQVHHSIQRIEVLSTNYSHPLDTISSLLIGSFLSYCLFGFNIEVAAWFSFYLGSMGYFLHSNISVPRWIGYIIQTPQMHRMHHEYGKHKSNYCDIVWFDMLFGTYYNPTRQEICDKCGFDEDKEVRMKDMLLFKDVHKKIN